MKFISKIIQFIQSAWSKLRLRSFSKFIRSTRNESSEGVKEPDSNSSSPTQTQPSEETETAPPPKQPKESQTQVPAETPEQSPQKAPDPSESSGATKDEISETQADLSKEETMPPSDPPPSSPSRKKPEPQSKSGQNKDSQKQQSEPPKAPGKRDEEPTPTTENDNREAKPQPPQCRFVCYEDDDGRWAVALAVEADQDAQSVRQRNNELHAKDCRYILEDIGAEVTVEFKGGHSSRSFQLFNEHKFAVFKMRKNWQGEGQKVKTLSSGDYVVFAHKSCGKRIGKPPIEPGRCRYDDFTVHFFSISEDSEKDGFKNCSLPFSSAKRFSLSGQRFPDDSDLGELFGDEAPQLDDAEDWRGISWITFGRENGGAMLAKFRPEEKTLAKVLDERNGWFFVRIYDANVDLLHSFPFRRVKGLNNILVNNQPLGEVAPIVPTKNGHTKTIVQFKGDLLVLPADDSNGICKAAENGNTFAVLPHPDNDGTKWVLGSGAERVEAEILLPRIWWKFINEKGKEGDWRDTPIEMERQAFRQAGNEKIRIRLPLCIPEVVVGFGDLNSPSKPTYPTKLSKDRKTCEVELRLDDFADDQAIAKRLPEAIYLRVKLKDSDIVFPIVRIPADVDSLKGCNLRELKRAKEELYQEREMAAAKAAEEFENFVKESTSKMRIQFPNDKGDIMLTILFNPQRKSMLAKNVEKLKAFFKMHFEKE